MSGAAPLHDVQGGVVEGDEGEAAGEAVLDKLLGGGGAGSDDATLPLRLLVRVRGLAEAGRGRGQARDGHRGEERQGDGVLARQGPGLGGLLFGDQSRERSSEKLWQILWRLGLGLGGHGLTVRLEVTLIPGLTVEDVLHGLLDRRHAGQPPVSPVVVTPVYVSLRYDVRVSPTLTRVH